MYVFQIVAFLFILCFNLNATKVSIKVENIDVKKGGVLRLMVCDEKNFLTESPFINCQITFSTIVKDANYELNISYLAEGDYVFYGFHDANNNANLELSDLGIPKEGMFWIKSIKEAPKFSKLKTLVRGDNIEVRLLSSYR